MQKKHAWQNDNAWNSRLAREPGRLRNATGRETAGDSKKLRNGFMVERTLLLGIASKVSWRLWLLLLPIKGPRRNPNPHPLLKVTLLAATPTVEVRDQVKATAMAGPNLGSPTTVMNPN